MDRVENLLSDFGSAFAVFSVVLVLSCFVIPSAMAQQIRPSQDGDASESETVETEADQTGWHWTARIRPRLEGRFNHQFGLEAEELNYGGQPNRADLFTQQSRLGVQAERDRLSGALTLQHTARWGVFGGDQLSMPPLSLYEGWLRYSFGDLLALQAGRFELAYGDQRVLGSVGWSQIGRAWDGLRLIIEPVDAARVDVFGVRYDDGQQGFMAGDSYLAGFYATWSHPLEVFFEDVDLYGLYDLRWGVPGELDRRQITMIGSRIAGEIEGFDATAEGGYQFGLRCPIEAGIDGCAGERSDVRAYFFDVEAGYAIALVRPFLGFSMASGNDPDDPVDRAYEQLYPTGHKWLGYMDIIGPRTNLREVRVGAILAEGNFRQVVAVHHFTRLQPETESVGLEANAKSFYDLSEGFTAAGGYGVFFPDRGISLSDRDPTEVAHWLFVQLVGAF